jgi:hypothetical protein
MATSTNVSTGFTGVLAGELILQAFKQADTIAKQAITVLPNIVASGYLPRLSYSAGLSTAQCGFLPTGNIDYVEKEIPTKKFQIHHEICKADFESTFLAQAAGLVSAHSEIPSTLQEAILKLMLDNLAEIIDAEIWQGTNTSTSFNGLLGQFDSDAAVIAISGSAVNKTNVLVELEKVFEAIPAQIEDEDDLIWIVSRDVAKSYRQNQAAQGLNTTADDYSLDYLGHQLLSIKGLPSSTMVVYRRKNLGYLTGLESNSNEVKVVDMDDTDMSGNIRTKIVFNAGVGYSFGNEIVFSKIR